MNKTQLKSFLHGSVASMIGVGMLGIMNYFTRRILSVNLSEIDYAFIYSAFALISVVMVFLDLGLAQASNILLAKSFAENDLQKSKKIFTLTFVTKLLLALIALVIMEILAPSLAHYYLKYPESTLLLMLMFLLIPTQTLESSLSCVISARKAFTTLNILMNIKAFIVLAGVFVCVKSYGVKSVALYFIAASITVTVLSFWIVRHYKITLLPLKTINFKELKKIFALSSWIAVSTAAISIMYSMDTICLTWLEGLKTVAMYQIALPVMQIAQSFFVFPMIFTPYVSEMWQKKDYAGIRRTCYLGSLLMLLTLPVFILVGIYFAPDIISFLFDKKFIDAAPAVTILWSGMVFFSIASFNMNALNSGGKQKNVVYMVVPCVLLNLILNIILIPQLSYIGAALATAITYFIMALASIINLVITFKNHNLKLIS